MAGQAFQQSFRAVSCGGTQVISSMLLVAPGATAPFTEGRKLLVRDLCDSLTVRGLKVEVVHGSPASFAIRMAWQAVRELRLRCDSSVPPDAVVAFPFGTFSGARAVVNSWFVRRAEEICRRRGIRFTSLFYSCAGLSLEQLGDRFGPALAVGRRGRNIIPVHLGIGRNLPSETPQRERLRRALFLCGYQQPSYVARRAVLKERGLIDVLRAGSALAEAGVSLTVAIPFLRHPRARQWLYRIANRICPGLTIEALGEVDPVALLASHDVFLFPYRSEHAVFVPTSLLEAMLIGVPVIAADHAMYRELTMSQDVPRCGLYRPREPKELAAQLIVMSSEYAAAARRARVTAAVVRHSWNMGRCTDELLAALCRDVRGGAGNGTGVGAEDVEVVDYH